MNLYYFTEDEFRRNNINWFHKCAPELLVRHDVWRHLTGDKIEISTDDGAIGRHKGDDDLSQHNIDKWGEVRAIDSYPKAAIKDVRRTYLLAIDAGFTGIGIYVHPRGPRFHCDVRHDRRVGDPATWGYIPNDLGRLKKVSLDTAIDYIKAAA
jgi:hypothetical protein